MTKRMLMMLAFAGVLLLLPLQALAAVCVNAAPFSEVLVLEIEGTIGAFFDLVGEHVGTCGANTSRPLSGTAHVRSTGVAHFGTISHNSSSSCVPVFIQGTLNPPSYTSGTGYYRNTAGGAGALTFSAASCPALPEALGGPAGTTTGTVGAQ